MRATSYSFSTISAMRQMAYATTALECKCVIFWGAAWRQLSLTRMIRILVVRPLSIWSTFLMVIIRFCIWGLDSRLTCHRSSKFLGEHPRCSSILIEKCWVDVKNRNLISVGRRDRFVRMKLANLRYYAPNRASNAIISKSFSTLISRWK